MKRSFDVVSIGTQRGEDRYPKRRREDAPTCLLWRCNLTALSQTRNLYFVAYAAEIYVYEPVFPSQVLSDPVLVLPSKPSARLPGYIDRRHPNAVNNLLVSHLGSEEVVAAVRDDGDVDVFLVRHIAQALDERVKLGLRDHNVRPIFQRNVGASTWGLAIHSEARVIAVSSNAHEITVFRFGLVLNQNDPALIDRSFDAQASVVNGQANIPCVAFCTTGDDPHARWLLTTDISGMCRVVDLHKAEVVQSFHFSESADKQEHAFDKDRAGWSIMFLDRKSFDPQQSFADAVGLYATSTPTYWELSPTLKLLPNVSAVFGEAPPKTDAATSQEVDLVGDELDVSSEEDLSSSDGSLVETLAEAPRRPHFKETPPPDHLLPGPILHASVFDTYLLQPGGDKSWHRPPDISIRYACWQALSPSLDPLSVFDRLNMTVSVPELGVVIVASQLGRALILALTKTRSWATPGQSNNSASVYAMRAEAIIPGADQERRGDRPLAPLHGIAASPLQNSDDSSCRRRWRLMLMYQDHSILSYEISRKVEAESLTQLII